MASESEGNGTNIITYFYLENQGFPYRTSDPLLLFSGLLFNFETPVVGTELFIYGKKYKVTRKLPPFNPPITVDNTGASVDTNSNQTLTLSNFTIGTGKNRILIVSVSYSQVPTGTTVTYNGKSLKLIGNIANGLSYTELWYVVNPPSGTFDIVATQTSAASNMVIGAVSFTGASQSPNPIGFIQSAIGNGTFPTVKIKETKPGSMLIDSLCTGTGALPPNTGQVSYYQDANPALITSQGSYDLVNVLGDNIEGYNASGGTRWAEITAEILAADITTNTVMTFFVEPYVKRKTDDYRTPHDQMFMTDV